MIPRTACFGVLVLSITACTTKTETSVAYTDSSRDVETSQLIGTFGLLGDSARLTAHAGFSNAATDNNVRLDGADEVYCDGVLLPNDGSWIGAEVPRKAPGETYRFELRRTTGSVLVDVAAIDKVAVLSPSPSTEVAQRSPVTVTWAPAKGTQIEAQLFANCAMSSAKSAEESGSLTLPAFVPLGAPGGPQNAAPPPCDGTVSLSRTAKGTATTALAKTSTLVEETDRVEVRVVE